MLNIGGVPEYELLLIQAETAVRHNKKKKTFFRDPVLQPATPVPNFIALRDPSFVARFKQSPQESCSDVDLTKPGTTVPTIPPGVINTSSHKEGWDGTLVSGERSCHTEARYQTNLP